MLHAIQQQQPLSLPDGAFSPSFGILLSCALQKDPAQRSSARSLLSSPFFVSSNSLINHAVIKPNNISESYDIDDFEESRDASASAIEGIVIISIFLITY